MLVLHRPFHSIPRVVYLTECVGIPVRASGDVLLHCVVDAILGALGLPDIGQIFPDSDPRWKGADSSVFMREAVSLLLCCQVNS
jgi:2-C-methyl-D-erythritol 2,4-cyclodiphosphate synthase